MEKEHFRAIFLYEYRLGTKAAETTRKIQDAFGEEAVNVRTVQRWFARFRSGDESFEDDHAGGHPPALDNGQLKTVVEQNPRTTVRELGEHFKVSKATVGRHMGLIGKVKKLDKWVPHELSEAQKQQRMEVSLSLFLRERGESFLDRVVTSDEKWIFYDNSKRSAQWLDKGETPKHMPKPALHPRKTMATIWWTAREVV